jgi:putative redox protein
MKTITTWKKEQQFESLQDHNIIHLDGNKVHGISPKAVLLSALAACSGIDIVEVLEKMRVSFSDFIIETTAEQTEEHPKVFRKVLIIYHIRTDAENEQKVKKAIDLSLDKYCGVAAMLKKNSPVEYKLIID